MSFLNSRQSPIAFVCLAVVCLATGYFIARRPTNLLPSVRQAIKQALDSLPVDETGQKLKSDNSNQLEHKQSPQSSSDSSLPQDVRDAIKSINEALKHNPPWRKDFRVDNSQTDKQTNQNEDKTEQLNTNDDAHHKQQSEQKPKPAISTSKGHKTLPAATKLKDNFPFPVPVPPHLNPLGVSEEDQRDYFRVQGWLVNTTRWRGTMYGQGLLPHPLPKRQWLDKDVEFMYKALQNGMVTVNWLSHIPMKLAKWEKELLAEPPLEDPLNAASAAKSTITLLSKGPLSQGGTAKVRIDAKDGRGRALRRGGDDVRAWMQNPDLDNQVAGQVQDLQNGTYIATFSLPWSGNAWIHANIQFNREFKRAVHRVRSSMKTTLHLMSRFSNDVASESTICSHFPVIPFYKSLCNLSKYNGGVGYYCGKPRDPGLSCDDWKATRDIWFTAPLPATKAEYTFNNLNWYMIPREIKIVIQPKEIPDTSEEYYNQARKDIRLKSWELTGPRGHFSRKTWRPFDHEIQIDPIRGERLLKCLKDTSIYLNGDSNLRLAFEALYKRIPTCKLTTGQVYAKWHKPLACHDKKYNISIAWQIHGLPWHGGGAEWCDRTDYKHVVDTLNEIPATGKYIVVYNPNIHYYHDHYSMIAAQVKAARIAMEKALKRNPGILLVVRGPHQANKKDAPLVGGDCVAPVFEQVIRDEFKHMQDKVLFISPWDMTIAVWSGGFHPHPMVDDAVCDTFLDYVCNTRS